MRAGRGYLPLLFGEATIHIRLVDRLFRGGFTVLFHGLVNQPRSCGPKEARMLLGFR